MLSPAVMIQISKLQYKRLNSENTDSELEGQNNEASIMNRCRRRDAIKIFTDNSVARVHTEQQTNNGAKVLSSSRTDSSVVAKNHHNENRNCISSPPAEEASDVSSATTAAGRRCPYDTMGVESIPEQVGELEGADAAEEAGGQSCFVCMDAAADAILIQCGHGGLCTGQAVFFFPADLLESSHNL
jgi:hypothetical protein